MSSPRLRPNIFELQQLEVRRFLTTASVDGTNTLQVLGTTSSENITVNRNTSNRLTVSGVATTFAIGSSAGQVNKIVIQASGGNDTIIITNNVRFPSNNAGIPVSMGGGNGNDTMTGGPGNDQLTGNDGDDTMDGGAGNDTMIGGNNLDTVNYSVRTGALRVTINNDADADGEVGIGENDKVAAEEVIGGAGNDTITGSSLADFIAGGGGNDSLRGGADADELIGSTGQDQLFGETGDDFLGAQNNDRDTVNGGTDPDGSDLDLASVDTLDVSARDALFAAAAAAAAAGADLDTTYGDDGIAVSPSLGWFPSQAAVSADGYAYFAGQKFTFDELNGSGYDIVVARFTPDGDFDTTFGALGFATIDFTSLNGTGSGYNDDDAPGGIAFDAAGNIIIAGTTSPEFGSDDFAVARLTSTGALDGTFGDGGRATMDFFESDDTATDVVVQDDGNIVVVGNVSGEGSDPGVARFTSTGLADEGFGGGDGHLLVSFGGADEVNAVALQTLAGDDGAQRIVIGGSSSGDFALARLLEDGTLDELGFGVGGVEEIDGVATTDFGGNDVILDLAVNSLNQIVAVGGSSGFSLLVGEFAAAAQEPGEVNGILAVYSPDAAGAPSFVDQPPTGESGVLFFQAVTTDDSDRIIVAGTDFEDFVVGRYLSNLSPDTDFAPGLVNTDIQFNDDAFAIGVVADGKILAAGSAAFSDESTRAVAVRYEGDGEEPPPNGEGEMEEVEEVVSYEDLQQNPPTGPLADHFEDRSNWAKLYMRSQPDDNGVVRIKSDDPRDNKIVICEVMTGEGVLNVTVSIDGLVLYYDPATTKLIELHTGGGNDTVEFCSDVDIPFFLDLGEGNDKFKGDGRNDYIFGGPGDDDLNGGGGNDILDGGPGDDKVSGGPGHDLLIGGAGKDQVNGTSGQDIIIGGFTAYDHDGAALVTILDEWTSGGFFDTRVGNIRNGGGLNGTNVLKTGIGATVFDDGDADKLQGASGGNWFFFRNTGPNNDNVNGNTGDDEIDFI